MTNELIQGKINTSLNYIYFKLNLFLTGQKQNLNYLIDAQSLHDNLPFLTELELQVLVSNFLLRNENVSIIIMLRYIDKFNIEQVNIFEVINGNKISTKLPDNCAVIHLYLDNKGFTIGLVEYSEKDAFFENLSDFMVLHRETVDMSDVSENTPVKDYTDFLYKKLAIDNHLKCCGKNCKLNCLINR